LGTRQIDVPFVTFDEKVSTGLEEREDKIAVPIDDRTPVHENLLTASLGRPPVLHQPEHPPASSAWTL
jgi:hypothetical protein